VGSYWYAVVSRALWESFALLYDNPRSVLLGVAGAIVTASLVWFFRGREAFMEHMKANVLIVVAGGIVTWIVIFLPYFVLRAPYDLFSDVQSQLRMSQERERAATIGREMAELKLKELKNEAIHWKQIPDQVNKGIGTRNRLEITTKLGKLIEKGNSLRDTWSQHLGGPEEVQRQSVLAIQGWHKEVEDYLNAIPKGSIYLARFHNRLAASGAYPTGINMNMAGYWDLLQSDLTRLNEFLTDPDLGTP
jgi:hypothetical protein